ncbi:MAG TPA: signal recognition particle-docking protein FtsY, partial [Gemmatimonadales bacterium]|nr:signal recognition particle-docking protein FtsY [Gemmatimonadales bacterium]
MKLFLSLLPSPFSLLMALLRSKSSLWSRIKRLALTDVGALVRGLKGDELEQIERILIEADFGVPATMDLVEFLEAEIRKGKLKTDADLRIAFAGRMAELLAAPGDRGGIAVAATPPTVILVMGVNGAGKTTTIAKLAHRLRKEGRKVLLAAADTWRAGAIEQLATWANRLGVEIVRGAPGGDPAAVAFDAVEAAINRGLDTVIIDTAGRLHTQDDLMVELGKVARVVARKLPGAPHEVLLVLDGTVGQNAVQQGKQFAAVVPPTGLVITKLDGSARGGAVVALRRELDVPVRFVGTGESIDDLEPFDPAAWAAP